jgi:hypothetical protein
MGKMRLTLEQRLGALERDNVVLRDTIKLLHRLLKEQRELISDYVTLKMTCAAAGDGQNRANTRPEDALYTFICKRRFDRIEKDMDKLRKLIESSKLGLKAG